MRDRIILVILTMFVFTGCAFDYAKFQDGYKLAKEIYIDSKYVVYEVLEEKKQVEQELKEKR